MFEKQVGKCTIVQCQKLKDIIKRTAQAVGSRDAKRKRYCCVLIVNNQPALLIALADYAISDKLAVRGGIGGTLCAESVQNDRHAKMLCQETYNFTTMTGGIGNLILFLFAAKRSQNS